MSMMDKMTDRLSAIAAVCDGNKHLSVILSLSVPFVNYCKEWGCRCRGK